jgi:hypothetical protein
MRDVMTIRPRLREAHPALKHGVYSTNTVLPGEDRAAFEELLRGLMDEHKPDGLSECEEVCYLAHLVWRRQNLPTNLHGVTAYYHRATDAFVRELEIRERLDQLIDRCLRRLLFIKGLKSVSSTANRAMISDARHAA